MARTAPDVEIAEDVVAATLAAWAKAGRCSRLAIHGRSMWPLLRTGDMVVVRHGASLRPGDVVAYQQSEGGVTIHRLLRRQPAGSLVLAGDACQVADPPIAAELVIGKVEAIDSSSGRRSLRTVSARILGQLLAVTFHLRSHRLVRRGLALLVTVIARLMPVSASAAVEGHREPH